MIFIDGDHEYNATKKDITNVLQHINGRPCILFGHDYGDTDVWKKFGVKQAVDELLPEREIIPHSSVWIVKVGM